MALTLVIASSCGMTWYSTLTPVCFSYHLLNSLLFQSPTPGSETTATLRVTCLPFMTIGPLVEAVGPT